jgi:hypothetical protein
MNIIYRMFVYDFLYILGDRLIKKHNPCDIQVSRSGLATCMCDIDVCCGECRYISIYGCTVTCLGCKLAICRKARYQGATELDISVKLSKMLMIAYSYRLPYIRTSRSETYQRMKNQRDLSAIRRTK